MSEIENHAVLGRIIYTDNALKKMRQYGLYRYQVAEAIQHGFDVKPLLANTHQRSYLFEQRKQIGVIFVIEAPTGQLLGAIKVLSCWSKAIK